MGITLRVPAAMVLGVLAMTGICSAQITATSKKFTTNADFATGTVFNLTNTPADQLQLPSVATTFPIMWIANAGEDTVVKINTQTNKQLARYKTWISYATSCTSNHCSNAYAGAAPSRTAVDSDGNVYVANRHFDSKPPSIMKILATGYIDRNGNGVEDTSTDTNGNGVIEYSEMIALPDTNGNGILDNSELLDERVAWIVQAPPATAGGLGRSLSIAPGGDLYLGIYYQSVYYRFSSVTGSLLGGPFPTPGNSPYGSIVDSTGILWGASLGSNLLKFNTLTNTTVGVYGHPGADYGIAIGPDNTGALSVYQANYSGYGYTKYNSVTNTWSTPYLGFSSLGVATDGSGNIFVGNTTSSGIRKYAPDGTFLCAGAQQPGTEAPRGVVVDSDGNVWAVHLNTDNLSKFRGTDCAALGVFPSGNRPYTYTDATGIQRFTSTAPTGTFTFVLNSGLAGNYLQKVQWNTEGGSVPTNTSIVVAARGAATLAGLGAATFTNLSNNARACVAGQFIEVRATLSTTVPGTTPVLTDISASGKCDVNGDGAVNSIDISLINAARNTTITDACDARDADANLIINVNDSRQCALKCTKPNCAL